MFIDSFLCLLFTFYLMARLANIMPKSAKSFDPRRHLTRGDVAVTSHGLLVTFKCTKTIQFGECVLHIPLFRINDLPCYCLLTHESFSSRSPFVSRFSHFRSQGPRSPYKA